MNKGLEAPAMPFRARPPRTRAFLADPIDRRVAARLSARRRELGIDAGLLDLLLGLRAGSVDRMEAGLSRIACRDLWRLGIVLGVDVAWFFAEPSSPCGAETQGPASTSGSHNRRADEARRFVALFARIKNREARAVIAEMVRALAERAQPDSGRDIAAPRRPRRRQSNVASASR